MSYAVAFCGGSGMAYGLRLVQVLCDAGCELHLCATKAAVLVLRHEEGVDLDPEAPDLLSLFAPAIREQVQVHPLDAVEAAPASGSAGIEGSILCPCSMGTLARVAHGFSSNLVERIADVALKQQRPLILVPRETPLSTLHLENMLKVARLGAVILPAMPGFYHRPQTVSDLVDFVVARILLQLGIDSPLQRKWQPRESAGEGPPSMWDEGEA